MANSITLTIDGTTVTVPQGTLVVEAAKTVDTDVPVYCYHPKLGPAGLCRICLVEIEKTPKLQIACNTVVTEGMVVHTYGAKVEDGRRAVMEFLLLNHPLDCPICDKGGECDLQDFSMAYGQSASRLADPKASKPKAIDLGPTIVLDDERCIVCQRCTRFDELITNERSLVVKDRGQRDVIATATGAPYRSNFSGNVTELCPVGALTSKTYRFKSRPWDNNRTHTTCTQCSVGCGLNVDERYGNVARTMSDPHDDAGSDGWLCDRGRYNIAFYADRRRITSPMLRRDDGFVQIGWDDAIELWARQLREALAVAGPASIAAIGGGRLLSEEIVLLERTMRGLGVENLDWRGGRQVQASPGARGGSYADLENAQAIVAFGRPPAQTAPILDLRIRKAVIHRGARYVTVGAHGAGSFVPATRVWAASEVAGELEGAARVAVLWDGIDVAAGRDAAGLVESLVARGADVACFVAGEQGNARGAEALGLVPRGGGLDAAGIFGAARAGTLRVLGLFGVNPLLHHPLGAAAVREALAAVPFVVATELFFTETAELANLVLPARGALEKTGHVYDLTGTPHGVFAAHGAPEGALGDGDILVALAAELSIDIPTPAELRAAAVGPAAPSAARFADAALVGRAPVAERGRTPLGAGELRLALASHIFAGGGTVFFDERLGALRPAPSVTLAPESATLAGVEHGDLVDLELDAGMLEALEVIVEDEAAAGIAIVIDGLPEAPANGFAEGETARIRNVRRSGSVPALGAAV
jgi:NADH-quinone oxidoreductase subunit G